MKLRIVATVIAFAGLGFVAAGASAPAQGHSLQTTFSGTLTATEVDSNLDGIKASSGLTFGHGTGGETVGQSLSELGIPVGPTVECPPPAVKVPYVASTVVVMTNDGSSYVEKLRSGFSCVDTTPGSGRFTFQIDYDIAGGTGRFEGATGTVRTTGSGRAVSVAPSGLPFAPIRATLSQFSGSSSGTIVVAK